jgi:hypothetical protein
MPVFQAQIVAFWLSDPKLCAIVNSSLIRINHQLCSFLLTDHFSAVSRPISEPVVVKGLLFSQTERLTLAKIRKTEGTVTVEQRKIVNRRATPDRRVTSAPVAIERRVGERRQKVNRRRQIDPTTCERDYTDAEIEFMHALDQYKRASGRMFPTCSEILEVIRGLGYEKTATKLASPQPGDIGPIDLQV